MPPEIENNPVPPKTSPNYLKIALGMVLFVFISIVVVVTVLYVWLTFFAQKGFGPGFGENDVVMTFVADADQFADWKTYRNEEYGFEFKYPTLGTEVIVDDTYRTSAINFIYKSKTDNTGNVSFGIFIDKNSENIPLEQWFQDTVDDNSLLINNGSFKLTNVYKDGNMYVFSGHMPQNYEGGPVALAYIMSPNKKYIFKFDLGQDSGMYSVQDYLSEILSTFKFISTSTSAVDTTNWKTYKNEKYGFEFKYPNNVGIVNEESGGYTGPPTNPQEDMLLIADKENTFHFQINNGILYNIKESLLGQAVLSTLKFTK